MSNSRHVFGVIDSLKDVIREHKSVQLYLVEVSRDQAKRIRDLLIQDGGLGIQEDALIMAFNYIAHDEESI